MRMGQGVRTGLGHGGHPCVLQTQFSSFFRFRFVVKIHLLETYFRNIDRTTRSTLCRVLLFCILPHLTRSSGILF